MGAAAHHVGEGLFLLMYIDRAYAFVATMIAVTMGPEVLWGARGRRLGTSTAPTGAASTDVVAFIIWSVGEF